MHSINNKLYLAGLFSCDPADLPGDCREYKGSLTTQNDIHSDKNRIQGGDRMQIGSENEMICLICHEELHFSETLSETDVTGIVGWLVQYFKYQLS